MDLELWLLVPVKVGYWNYKAQRAVQEAVVVLCCNSAELVSWHLCRNVAENFCCCCAPDLNLAEIGFSSS